MKKFSYGARIVLTIALFFVFSLVKSQTDTLYYNKDFKKCLSIDSCEYWRVVNYSDSTFVDYYQTGEVMVKGAFSFMDSNDDSNTCLEGEVMEYYKDGVLEGFYCFQDGLLNGRCVLYYSDGNVKEAGVYKNGDKEGLFTLYTEKRESSTEEFYIKGERCDLASEPYRIAMASGGGFHDNQFGISFNSARDKKLYKSFDKYLNKFDPTKRELGKLAVSDASVFWNTVIRTNLPYADFKIKKKTKKVHETINKFNQKVKYNSIYYDDFPKLFHGFPDPLLYCDFIRFFQGMNPDKPVKSILIEGGEERNACVTPDGVLFITIDLFYSLSPEELLGVLAHEMAHYILEHALVHELAAEKRERENRLAAAILSGVNAVGHAVVQANGGVRSEDRKEYWENVEKLNEAIRNGFERSSALFSYRYSRGQEMEADIVAYRFLQYMGYDPRCYIRALGKLIGFDKENPSIEGIEMLAHDYNSQDEYSTHPSILERCMMLEYIELYDRKQQVPE